MAKKIYKVDNGLFSSKENAISYNKKRLNKGHGENCIEIYELNNANVDSELDDPIPCGYIYIDSYTGDVIRCAEED